MKHKSTLKPPTLPGVKVSDCSGIFHPLSYYLNGGVDLNGELADKSAEVEYDNEEQLKELEAEGASSVALGDPRVGYFELVEQAGARKASKASASNPKPAADVASTSSTEIN